LKVILYGITVFSLFITASYRDPVAISLFAILLAGIGFIATSSWALGGNLFRKFLRQNYRIFNFVMAGLLVFTALEFFFAS
jgi:cysteine/O-acetylserine efflux protein